jgi:acyl dehydratase
MPVNDQAVGKTYAPTTYAVGREKVKEFALATGETNPLHLDHRAAREGRPRRRRAPAHVLRRLLRARDGAGDPRPDVGINFALMVHGGQEFRWGPLVVAGDEIETAVTVKSITERDGKGFYVFESASSNQRGETVCVGTWTNIVRGV